MLKNKSLGNVRGDHVLFVRLSVNIDVSEARIKVPRPHRKELKVQCQKFSWGLLRTISCGHFQNL